MKEKNNFRISLHVPPKLAEKLNKKVEARGGSLNEYCINALESYVNGLVLKLPEEEMTALRAEAEGIGVSLNVYIYLLISRRKVISWGHLPAF